MRSAPAFSLQGFTDIPDRYLLMVPGPHPICNGLNLIEAFGDAGRGAFSPLHGVEVPGPGSMEHECRQSSGMPPLRGSIRGL